MQGEEIQEEGVEWLMRPVGANRSWAYEADDDLADPTWSAYGVG